MLDHLTAAVLEIVNAGSDGSYKVLETSDFLSALPDRLKTDEAGLDNSLRFLSERGYIDIRYSDKGTYCLCSLPKGRTYAESAAKEEEKKKSRGGVLAVFFGALAGGFLGALAAGLLAAFYL